MLATLAVVGVTLALFASGKIRASKQGDQDLPDRDGRLRWCSRCVNVVLMIAGVVPADNCSALALAASLGIIIGVSSSSWRPTRWCSTSTDPAAASDRRSPQVRLVGAFGIMVTVVWLYVELLRLIAIFRN